ncbi:MAG: acyltransferase family protein [Clostridiales bacterium]|nr:acyltransferase family protein [Clostridiales bacterium]
MAKSKRQANYELLRIIAMLMVVTLHYLNHTGALLVLGGSADAKRIIGTLLESFCIVAVNVYVLISGYFLVEAGFKIKRVLILICQVLFYAMIIPLVMLGSGAVDISDGGIYEWIRYIFPIGTEHYWFATSYVILYLFTPVLNLAVKNMNKRQLQITLAGLLIFFCGIKSIVPVQLVTDRFGYDFGWFLCVYLLAAYIRLYGLKTFSTGRCAWLVYVGCALAIFAIVCGFYFINRKTGAFAYYFEVPFHYNYILCLAAAVALFYAFGYVNIPEGKAASIIRGISPLTFGVYLFHEHIDIRTEWSGWIDEFIGPAESAGTLGFLIHLLLSVILVYAVGIFIDAIRRVIFNFIGRYTAKTKLALWMDKIGNSFS